VQQQAQRLLEMPGTNNTRYHMKYGLSPRQKIVFDYIKSYMKKQPVAPSYEEMMIATGYKSKSAVFNIIKQLEERKWITRLPGKNRSIRINQ